METVQVPDTQLPDTICPTIHLTDTTLAPQYQIILKINLCQQLFKFSIKYNIILKYVIYKLMFRSKLYN